MKKTICVFASAMLAVTVLAEALPTMAQGWILLDKKKDLAGAEKHFKAVIEKTNEKYSGTVGLMFALRRQGKNDEVIKRVDEWLAANPQANANQKANLLGFKGNALRDLKKVDEALAVYKAGYELKSPAHHSISCAKEYIRIAFVNNKKDLAFAMYDEVCKNPQAMKNPGFMLNAAMIMWQAQRGEEALKLVDNVEKITSENYAKEQIYRIRGYILRDHKKDYEAAVKAFEQALAVPGLTAAQQAVIWNNIGITYERDEEYEKAVEAYKKVGATNAKGWFMKSAANAAKRLQKKIDAGE